MAQYTLHYFDIRARGELSRLIFAAAGVQYTDDRVSFDNWGPESPLKAATPLGQLPYLEVDGVKLPQSISIARFLAREFNLSGRNNLEQAKADAVVDTAVDFANSYFSKGLYKSARNNDEWNQFIENDAKKHLGNLDKLVSLYGSNGHSAADVLLWSDLFLYDVVSQIIAAHNSDLLDHFANVKAVFETVSNHPHIAEYVKNRKETPF